jgi:putative nucleotidyltransferase with HDIG domain
MMTELAPANADDEPTDATPTWTVLCVDDEPNILSALRRAFRGTGYRVLVADGGAQALQVLASETVHLVISDMRMPGMDGAQLLEQVRRQWPEISRMLLTGHADVGSTIAAINRGEIFRYIAKPWNQDDLLLAAREALERQALLREKARLERVVARRTEELTYLNAHLEQQVSERTVQLSSANARVSRNYLNSIKAFSNLTELRGGQMAGHSRRVAELARRIAVAMNLPAADVQDIFVAGLLHDIGQVGLPDAVLACPVPRMTPEERARYVKHAELGEQALLALEDMQRVALIVRSHHERHDGKGFPEGLAGEAIPVGARILALADTFDDLQSGHVARVELKSEDARMLIERGSNTQFEPSVVGAFLEVTCAPEPPPSFIELPVDKLKSGMVLARDLCSGEGVVLLAGGHVLSASLIERICAHAARRNLSLLIAVRTARAGGAPTPRPRSALTSTYHFV